MINTINHLCDHDRIRNFCPYGYERNEPSTIANLAELQKFMFPSLYLDKETMTIVLGPLSKTFTWKIFLQSIQAKRATAYTAIIISLGESLTLMTSSLIPICKSSFLTLVDPHLEYQFRCG